MIWALHGNLGQPGDWKATARFLQPVQVFTPSLWEASPLPFAEWAGALIQRVEGESGEGRVLMGYSLGARLAMHALLQRPQAWRAAVFVSGHPGLAAAREREARLAQDQEWARRLRAGPVSAFLRAWNAQPVFGGEEPAPGQESLLQQHRAAMAEAFSCWSLGRQEDLRSRLLACPVRQLWVAGHRDVKFAALARTMAGASPRSSLAILADCGHRVLLHKPRELAECVHHFLEAENPTTRDVDTSC